MCKTVGFGQELTHLENETKDSKTQKSVRIIRTQNPNHFTSLEMIAALLNCICGCSCKRRWVRGVLICTYAAFGVLMVNITLTIVAAAVSVAGHSQRTMSSATIYKYSCDRTKAYTTGLHLLINVLSTIILGASSYCMQCLTAPSRADVDRAHGQRVWLDIGVASVRNLAWADWPRLTLWLVLLVTSFPIHLMQYDVQLASADFDFNRLPAHYNSSYEECFESNTTRSMSSFYADLPSFENLTKEECVRNLLSVLDQWVASPPVERPQYSVEYCLSRKLTEQCELQFSPAICLVVIVCNIIKVLCMSLTALSNRTDIFLTVGDAVASFLSRPDPSIERMGLVSRSNLFSGPQPWPSFRRDYLQLAVKDTSRLPLWATLPPRQRWTRALPTSQWIATISVYVRRHFALKLGFGSATPYTIVLATESSNVIHMALLANTPQIFISVGYFLYNNLVTHMLLVAEYDDYASQRKPLRVSWPQGSQRSSYYLSLPYRYNIPLMVASMLLHWLVAGSLFFFQINSIDAQGETVDALKLIGCGYGPIAIVFALILGGMMTCTVVGLGMRRFTSQMPIAGSCSAAISAACHPIEGCEETLVENKDKDRTQLQSQRLQPANQSLVHPFKDMTLFCL
ncbi:uncharacterized protein BO87DRAFT_410151 [Aspergillus neoniger CBS 115656]|uniref:DUF6536 domain-containing protein n=1 Tax=Aspergillus neoniger (strain CBS 115656) TaxID=1448310 RepID=A0A318Y6P3_ASPNB|nr:hypothetical protein BO87DRAFT_410151 [Aspergillus neoniger CBS 115656]PYH29891.1 hypothetical protein BO87DRAFT_410151 [Aspergillus neoniger CBS 115656]